MSLGVIIFQISAKLILLQITMNFKPDALRTGEPDVEHRFSACTASIPPAVRLLRHLATIGSTIGIAGAALTDFRSEKTILRIRLLQLV